MNEYRFQPQNVYKPTHVQPKKKSSQHKSRAKKVGRNSEYPVKGILEQKYSGISIFNFDYCFLKSYALPCVINIF